MSASVTTARGISCGFCACARVISDSVEKAQPLSALFPSCFHRLAGVRRSVSRSMPSVTQQLLNTITGGLSPARRPVRNKEVYLPRAAFSFHIRKKACYHPLRGQHILGISLNCQGLFVISQREKYITKGHKKIAH